MGVGDLHARFLLANALRITPWRGEGRQRAVGRAGATMRSAALKALQSCPVLRQGCGVLSPVKGQVLPWGRSCAFELLSWLRAIPGERLTWEPSQQLGRESCSSHYTIQSGITTFCNGRILNFKN